MQMPPERDLSKVTQLVTGKAGTGVHYAMILDQSSFPDRQCFSFGVTLWGLFEPCLSFVSERERALCRVGFHPSEFLRPQQIGSSFQSI